MAEHIHHTHSNNDQTSAATILVSVVIVLIIALAFYFGVIRGNIGGGNAGGSIDVELNAPEAGGGGPALDDSGTVGY